MERVGREREGREMTMIMMYFMAAMIRMFAVEPYEGLEA